MNKTIEELAKDARREYHREWCKKNKDKVRAINRRYWEKRAAALAATQVKERNNDESND